MIALFTWATVGLLAGGVVFTAVLACRRLQLAREDRRRVEAELRLRPSALALLDGEEAPPEPATAREAEILAALVARLGRQLSGSARERLGAFFERSGGVEGEIRRLRSRRSWRRATAAHSLGDMGSRVAVPALLGALRDPAREVRAAAARSLGRLGAVEAVDPLVYGLVERSVPRAVAGQALLAIGPAALPALRRLESAQESEAREIAIELVGLLGDASEGALLVERLRDGAAEVRAKAARALGRLAAEEGAAELRATLHDRIPFVRAAAAVALGAMRDRDAVDELRAVAVNDQYEPARAAAYALARIDPDALSGAPLLDEAADVAALAR